MTLFYCPQCGTKAESKEPYLNCSSCPSRYMFQSFKGKALPTHDEVQDMLKKLSEYFHEPVLPVSRYCSAFEKWFIALKTKSTSMGRDGSRDWWGKTHLIMRDIYKSNLLYRLIYQGEKFRTQECPMHKGEWSGLDNPDRPCPHGCQMTGWLPEP